MKNKIKYKIILIICLSFLLMSIDFWGIQQRISLIYYFLVFIIRRDKTDFNLYKALSHGFLGLKKRVLKKNKRELLDSIVKLNNMSAKQKSQNRITVIVDDTCDGEKYSKKSNKLHRARDNSIKKTVKTHTIVFLVFTVGMGKESLKYTIDFRLWRKGFKKKSELFLDMLIDLREMLISSGISLVNGYFQNIVIVFDSGYSYNSVLEKIDDFGFYFVGKYHHKKKHIIFGKEVVLTTWLKSRFRAKDFNKVNTQYKIRCKYYKDINLSDSNWRFILCLFKRKGHKKRPRRFLVSNLKNKTYYTVIERYQQRYYIEGIFRDLKQLYDFKDFHRTDLGTNFDDYVSLCILRYDFVQKVKRENHLMKKSNGYVVKLLRKELNNISCDNLKKWFSDIVEKRFIFYNTA